MSPRNTWLATLAVLTLSAPATASPVDDLLGRYTAEGAGPFSADAGARLWIAEQRPEARSCATCHGEDLTQTGKHTSTGKRIAPLAPSANPERLTDRRKIEKWLYRNCKWTLGRECTAQEKGDLLSHIRSQ
jgi:cytochrome c553